MPFKTQRRRGGFALTALLVAVLSAGLASAVGAQTVTDPRVAEFDPSPDHWAALETGQPAVLRYTLEIYLRGALSPYVTVDMGKPSPAQDGKIRYEFASALAGLNWPTGQFEARVTAVGPGGSASSGASNPFAFSAGTGCALSLTTASILAPAAGGQYSVGVSTGDGCRWAATTSQSWLTLSTTSESGSGTLRVQVRASTLTYSRTGIVYAGGQALTIWQAAGASGPVATTPKLSWPTPLAITQGTPLGALQLNATASVAGAFTYAPQAGTVLPAGTHTLTATFVPADRILYRTATTYTTLVVDAAKFRLSVSRPSGGTISGAGINCGTLASVCQVTMPSSMTLGLQATADKGFSFSRWSGDCTGTNASTWLALNGVKTCGAVFATAAAAPPAGSSTSGGTTAEPEAGSLPAGPPFTLTVSRPTGGTVAGAGINCGSAGSTCQVSMPASMTLGLQAIPDAGYVFSNWTGHCSGTAVSLWLPLTGPRTCGAAFTLARDPIE
jgi:hypothetical protein